jgi:hypothetical protein
MKECKIYFAERSAKFILQKGVQNLFCRKECKIYFAGMFVDEETRRTGRETIT